ncbi:MAG: FeoB small GTPase domain-containing protein [Bacillota bacterium]|jgi:ferrous iron transport protein B|nr:FeoB small GTPase domain-containing protein [Bacillota bacterium]NLP22122.1 ferrous iron transporter B [Erysipelotrichaceae bacterium]
MSEKKEIQELMQNNKTILLMGAPNVGKSVFFTHYTKVHVISSNYAGTTVSYMKGDFTLAGNNFTMIDVPGTYSLTSSNEAEELAILFLENNPDGILFVLNAADLEGSIKLFLEVKNYNKQIVCALNLCDVAKRQGKEIDVELLSKELDVPIISTVAVKQEGFKELDQTMESVFSKLDFKKETNIKKDLDIKELWKISKEITDKVVSYTGQKANFLDNFGQKLLKPWPGILYAILIIILSIGIVVGAGKALRAVLLLPLVNNIIVPFFETIFIDVLKVSGILGNVLIGEYGIFRIGFEWIIALILPYVLLFQLVFAFLEDSGLLPRIAILFDNLMSKIGVQGGSLINIMLAFGCAVPAIIGTRTAPTKKERLVVSTLICFTIPCISQSGALISLLGDYSIFLILLLMFANFVLFVLSAKLLSKFISGEIKPMVIEIPNLLIPEKKSFFLKFKARMKSFLIEAEGPMLLAVVLASILTEAGLLDGFSKMVEPIVSGWLGLPSEASLALILGVIRREMSVAPLLAMNLTALQMFTGAIVSLLYLPCLSVIGVLTKEFDLKTSILIFFGTIFNAIFVGGLINQVVSLFI